MCKIETLRNIVPYVEQLIENITNVYMHWRYTYLLHFYDMCNLSMLWYDIPKLCYEIFVKIVYDMVCNAMRFEVTFLLSQNSSNYYAVSKYARKKMKAK